MDVEDARPALPERVEALLKIPSTWDQPPDGFADDLLAGLRRERDGGVATPPNRGGWFGRSTRVYLLAAAAAVLVVVAGFAVGLRVTGGDSSAPGEQVALAGTALDPQATGAAEIVDKPSGFQITLHVEDLPPAPVGSYYQAWLKTADGDLVTIGTFHARAPDAIVLWSGVDPADYSMLTVTLQQVGEGAESSGQAVLVGNLP